MLLHLNPSSGVPVYLQLEAQVKQAVSAGALRTGEAAASARAATGGRRAAIAADARRDFEAAGRGAGQTGRPAMSEAAILTEGLSKSFGTQAAVAELNLKIQTGAVYGFLGRNGAGKTKTMRMLLGLVRPTEGRARVLGVDPGKGGQLVRSM